MPVLIYQPASVITACIELIKINMVSLDVSEFNGAVEKTRTSTRFPGQRPQRCASTNSATTALYSLIIEAH